jgi:hypothetical protein
MPLQSMTSLVYIQVTSSIHKLNSLGMRQGDHSDLLGSSVTEEIKYEVNALRTSFGAARE